MKLKTLKEFVCTDEFTTDEMLESLSEMRELIPSIESYSITEDCVDITLDEGSVLHLDRTDLTLSEIAEMVMDAPAADVILEGEFNLRDELDSLEIVESYVVNDDDVEVRLTEGLTLSLDTNGLVSGDISEMILVEGRKEMIAALVKKISKMKLKVGSKTNFGVITKIDLEDGWIEFKAKDTPKTKIKLAQPRMGSKEDLVLDKLALNEEVDEALEESEMLDKVKVGTVVMSMKSNSKLKVAKIDTKNRMLVDKDGRAVSFDEFQLTEEALEEGKYINKGGEKYRIEKRSISDLKGGETVMIDGEMKTVGKKDVKSGGFTGSTLFGSPNKGQKVDVVIFWADDQRAGLTEEAKIDNEKEFTEYALEVLEKAFGDKFDKKKADATIKGILGKVKDDDYGPAIGMLTSGLGEEVELDEAVLGTATITNDEFKTVKDALKKSKVEVDEKTSKGVVLFASDRKVLVKFLKSELGLDDTEVKKRFNSLFESNELEEGRKENIAALVTKITKMKLKVGSKTNFGVITKIDLEDGWIEFKAKDTPKTKIKLAQPRMGSKEDLVLDKLALNESLEESRIPRQYRNDNLVGAAAAILHG